MGILDAWARRRGYVKPNEVKRGRKLVPAFRTFDGAKSDRLMYGFTTSPSHVNLDLQKSWGALVARARELAKNDDYVRRYMRVARNNVLGPHGIRLQGQVVYTAGEKRGEPDDGANQALEDAWTRWGKKGICDTTGKLSWRDVQCLVVNSVMRDGESIVQIVRNNPRNDFRYGIRVMDVASLPWEYNVSAGDRFRNKINMGVELDPGNRPVAYHFSSNDAAAKGYYNNGGRGYVRVPATFDDGSPRILHIFQTEEIDQVRGFTGLASAIMRLKMLGGYEEATLIGARVGASQMLFFEQGEGGEYMGDDADDDGAPVDEIEPGIARVLPPGWKAHAFDPKQPSTAYMDFTKQTLRGIAAGLGMSYITLANDLESVNYSSARVGVLEDREEWKGVQTWLIESLCEPVFDGWLPSALLTGQIVLPSGAVLKPERYDKLSRIQWMPRRWDWVDPLKEMQAHNIAVAMRARSISDVIRERGNDPEDVFREIQRERRRLEELGITPDQALEAATDGQQSEEN